MDDEKFINYANPSGINPITVYQATKALECTDIRVAKKLENDLEQYFKKNYLQFRDKLRIWKNSATLHITIMSTNKSRVNFFINNLIEELVKKEYCTVNYFSGILYMVNDKDIFFNLLDIEK